MRQIGWRVILKRLAAVKTMMRDRAIPFWKKALVVFGVIYVIVPVDVVPIMVFPISWMDDLILWVFIIWTLKDTLDKYWLGDGTEDLSGVYHDDKIIKDVDFEVKDDDDNDD